MDEKRKLQVIRGLTLVASGAAIARGFEITAADMENIVQPLVQQGVEQFFKTNPTGNEKELVDIGTACTLRAVDWVSSEVPKNQPVTNQTLTHAIHKRFRQLEPRERAALKAFFPTPDYEV